MQSKHLQILAFTNGTASHRWRLSGIANRLNNETEHEMFVAPWQAWNKDIVGANIVIIEHLTSPEMVKVAHDQGAKVIFEADDAFLDTYGKERKNLQVVVEGYKNDTIETLRRVDALTVTSEELKKNYARFTKKPIYVLPNYVDFNWYNVKEKKVQRVSDEIRLGWFGSRGHFEDLKAILPVLKKLLEDYPNLRLVYCGYGGFSSDKLGTESAWGEDVFREIPRDRREFYLATKEEMWPDKHRLLDLDIGIAPLIDDYFNRCKTPIKWMEYAIMRTPAVCSKILYDSVVKNGETGFLAANNEEWEMHIRTLIEDSKLRQKMGKSAEHVVKKKYDLEKHWNKWLEVYKEVLNM